MDIQLIRDKVAGFLLIREIGQLRSANKSFRSTELTLNLFSVPRIVKLHVLWFLCDATEPESDSEAEEIWEEGKWRIVYTEKTDCESLTEVNKGCWDTYRSGTRNYSKFA